MIHFDEESFLCSGILAQAKASRPHSAEVGCHDQRIAAVELSVKSDTVDMKKRKGIICSESNFTVMLSHSVSSCLSDSARRP